MKTSVPRAVVITAVHGRHTHLRRMRAGLAASTKPPLRHQLVAMADPEISRQVSAEAQRSDGDRLTTEAVEVPRSQGRLPLAEARNRGAELALRSLPHPEDLLIFLDVDCIPAPELVGAYLDAAARRPDDLLCGPVAYLPELPAEQLDVAEPAQLAEWAAPHPARPAPEPGEILSDGEHALFWSLSFAVRRSVWQRIGGFDEAYTGYGAEDTDFAWRARAAGVGLSWVGAARAFHQHHPVSSPPVEHLEDILRNGRTFAGTWGHWPMEGWLEEFRRRGLVRREGADWVAVDQASVDEARVDQAREEEESR
ncbi:glycosyltransferase family 2 protein [Nesterenkonia lutea]|uniref:GT2 family glycosyltransferase n=1 Tax=Nesterenkonia lutea TaxID=272919 RepID=A0ABR9JFN7_9MICC|nr:galactosyltransferase-related protein [Nesterenkonia lutea]MBE1524610.1 GT2 family glycosyltransferase [Nesterenkonia lutea]